MRDKFEMSRTGASLAVGVPAALLSLVLFSTTSGLYVLDILDHFVNQFGVLLVAVVAMLVLAWGVRALPQLQDHLNQRGSVPIGAWWRVLISVVAPLALAYVLVQAFLDDLETPYGGYPGWMLATFGWGAALLVIVVGLAAARLPWRPGTSLEAPVQDVAGPTEGA